MVKILLDYINKKYIAEWTGEVPAWSHKPENPGSNPGSATNKVLFE